MKEVSYGTKEENLQKEVTKNEEAVMFTIHQGGDVHGKQEEKSQS